MTEEQEEEKKNLKIKFAEWLMNDKDGDNHEFITKVTALGVLILVGRRGTGSEGWTWIWTLLA